MLDKEVPFSKIPSEQMHLYEEAEAKEWADWQKNGGVKIISPSEARQIKSATDPRRIINLRFAYRDKNASIRTPQSNLPVKAKARLCALASLEPTALRGMAKLDSPTVQRLGAMIFLQLVLNLGWTQDWIKCDISSAFL